MVEGLKACPFCGGLIVEVDIRYFDILSRRQLFYGGCSCGAQGPTALSRADAIAKWNRRALPVPGLGAVILADAGQLEAGKAEELARFVEGGER